VINIIVTGSFGFDYIMDFSGRFADRIMPDKLHCLSLSFLVDKLSKQYGGTAGNVAYTLKLLGMNPLVLAPAGNDFVPYREFLEKHHMNIKYVSIHKNVSTSAYFVMTDKDDNQIGSFFTGAMMYAKKLHIADVKEPSEFVILAPTEPEAMKQYVRECTALKRKYLYDPAFQIGNFKPEELRDGITHAQILIGNDYEIALIKQKLEITHEELICMVPILITTLGPKGSIIETRHDAMHINRANAENTSDPTGAGDAFRAGFLAGYLRGYDLQVCGQMGSVAAAYTVEKYGTQTHEFTEKEFIARYKENFGKTISL
jgi:adenosine kinase